MRKERFMHFDIKMTFAMMIGLAMLLSTAFITPVLADDTAEPGKQIATSIELPKNNNEFLVRNGITLTEQKLDDAEKETVQFFLYLPKEYKEDGKPMPLMLFMHGAGERGDNLEIVKKHGPPKVCEKQEDWPFITISPQCPTNRWWNASQMMLLVKAICEKYNVDEDRIYVTGLSMGGFGTWTILSEYPDRVAAAVPICGKGDPKAAEKMVDIPIWCFHGGKDTTVPTTGSTDMVEAIKKAGGENIELTIYPEAGHDSWTETYDNPKVYEFLLKHSLKERKQEEK